MQIKGSFDSRGHANACCTCNLVSICDTLGYYNSCFFSRTHYIHSLGNNGYTRCLLPHMGIGVPLFISRGVCVWGGGGAIKRQESIREKGQTKRSFLQVLCSLSSRGFQGSFIATPFTRFKDFHSYAK